MWVTETHHNPRLLISHVPRLGSGGQSHQGWGVPFPAEPSGSQLCEVFVSEQADLSSD